MLYFLGLGSNIGELEKNLEKSIRYISEIGEVSIEKSSSYYKTKPWGDVEQDDFLNMMISVKTDHQPDIFLNILQEIEQKMGKKVLRKWGPRIIDIDIVFCDDLVIESENLKIPHPHSHERDFVLLPMLEIAPDFFHPTQKKKIKDLYEQLRTK